MDEKILKDGETNAETPALEDMFADLEGVIGKMEGTDVTLEQSFELYNQGMELLKKCSQAIDTVEKKRPLYWTRMVKNMNFNEEYEKRLTEIESILTRYLPEKEGYQKIIMEAMEYSLMAGGKRLRPMLMLESFRLLRRAGGLHRTFYGRPGDDPHLFTGP